MKKIPVIIDCDPGHDDALALILAFASDKLDVRAVTVTGGNQTLAKTLWNARRVLSFIGKQPPLGAGADKPMFRELETAPAVHGESGLDGTSLPGTDYGKDPLPAVDLMRKIILQNPAPLTLIPTGPLTNLGILFTAYPEVKANIGRISLMGGSIAEGGNWTGAAEFNILVDPEAADIVFSSGIPITMSGLDVTHKAMIMEDEIAALRKLGGKVPALAADLMTFFSKYDVGLGFKGAPLHDPCAVACLIAPELFSAREFHVDIETRGRHTLGMTVADLRFWTKAKPNVSANMDVDREGFIKLLMDACDSYPK